MTRDTDDQRRQAPKTATKADISPTAPGATQEQRLAFFGKGEHRFTIEGGGRNTTLEVDGTLDEAKTRAMDISGTDIRISSGGVTVVSRDQMRQWSDHPADELPTSAP